MHGRHVTPNHCNFLDQFYFSSSYLIKIKFFLLQVIISTISMGWLRLWSDVLDLVSTIAFFILPIKCVILCDC